MAFSDLPATRDTQENRDYRAKQTTNDQGLWRIDRPKYHSNHDEGWQHQAKQNARDGISIQLALVSSLGDLFAPR